MDTYVYEIGGSLYINLTNRCSNACGFCVRNDGKNYDGYDLFLRREPAAGEVLSLVGDPLKYHEIVFCGYGEPTCRYDEMMVVARQLKIAGAKLRLNTNGQGDLIVGRDISGELAQCFDTVSISLNAVTSEKYQEICKSEYGNQAFDALIGFAARCARAGINVVMSVVDILPAEDIETARAIAKSCGAAFRLRELIT